MSRLRNAFEHLASRGTSRGADPVFSAAVQKAGAPSSEPLAWIDQGDEIMISTAIPIRKRPAWVAFAAAFGVVLAVGVAGTLLVRPDSGSPPAGQDVAGGGSAVNTAVPGATLAPADSTPMTVPAEAPLSYYTYLPDLHLAWRATADGASTEICWKTPEGEGCASDDFQAPNVVVIPNGPQVFILTRAEFIPDGTFAENGMPNGVFRDPTHVTIEFSDGSETEATLTTPDGIGITYARIDLPDGATVKTAAALPD